MLKDNDYWLTIMNKMKKRNLILCPFQVTFFSSLDLTVYRVSFKSCYPSIPNGEYPKTCFHMYVKN